MTEPSKTYSGYSPPVTIELEVGASKFSVGSLSADKLALRDAKSLPPLSGVVRLTVDGHVTVYHVELPEGIDPQRDEQIYHVVESDVSAVV